MRTIGLFAATGLLAGCELFGFASPTACPAALLEGTLAPDSLGGALVVGEFGPQAVQWPTGYAVSTVGGKVQLLDPGSRIVAAEGDPIYVGGGMSPDNTAFVACGYVSTEPP